MPQLDFGTMAGVYENARRIQRRFGTNITSAKEGITKLQGNPQAMVQFTIELDALEQHLRVMAMAEFAVVTTE